MSAERERKRRHAFVLYGTSARLETSFKWLMVCFVIPPREPSDYDYPPVLFARVRRLINTNYVKRKRGAREKEGNRAIDAGLIYLQHKIMTVVRRPLLFSC